MLPIRSIRLVAVLLALFLAACASNRPAPAPPPDEIAAFVGEEREDAFVNQDGLKIFGRFWLPVSEPRAVVVLIHGTAMHSGLYDEFGRYLATKNYLVYGIDLQGWGRSDGIGPRGDVYNHDKYVSDIGIMIDQLRAEYPNRPVFGFGESLGGTVALLGQVQRRVFFDGLILSAPGYKPNPKLLFMRPPAILANWGLSTVAWWGSHFERWPLLPTNLGLRMIVHDKQVQKLMLADPYVTHTWLPAHYVTTLAEANRFLKQRIEMIHVPLFVLQGSKDELIPMSSAEEIAHHTLSRDTRLKVYKGAGHALMLQPQRYEAMIDIGKWLDDRTSPR